MSRLESEHVPVTMNAAIANGRFEYQAFISYSQSADENLSACLQKGLQRYSKPWYRRRMARVFRDETTLTPNKSLADSIQNALDNSEHFILLASPAAAKSQWVGREIDFWTRKNGTRGLIIVLTEGELFWSSEAGDFDRDRSNALPGSLYGQFEEEPLFLDLRWFDDAKTYTLREPELVDAIATLAAVIHHRPKDELVGEDLRQHRRTVRVAWVTAGLLFCLGLAATIAAVWAVQQRDLAETREKQARAQLLAAVSERLLREQPDQSELATLLAIESVHLSPSDTGQRQLAAAAHLLPGRVAEQFAGELYAVAISPDQNTIVSGSEQMGVMAWNLAENTGQQLSTASEIEEQLQTRAIKFSRDGAKLATANGGNIARVWKSLSEDPREFSHQDQISTVDFNPDADLLATGGKDGFVRVWDIKTGQAVFEHGLSSEEVREVGFSPDGAWLGAVTTSGPVAVYKTNTWERIELEPREPETGLALAFSPDSTMFAASRGNRAEIWSLEDGHSVMTVQHSAYTREAYNAGSEYVLDVAFNTDSTVFATASRDGTVRLWSLATGEELSRLIHETQVSQIQFTPDGKYIGTGSVDLVQLWRLPEGDEVMRVSNTGSWGVMAFSADGSLLVTGGPEDSLRLLTTSNLLYDYQLTVADDVLAVACHPGKQMIATADDSHNVQIWNLGAKAEIMQSANLFNTKQLKFTSQGDLFVAGQTGVHLMRPGDASVTELVDGGDMDEVRLHPDFAAVKLGSGDVGIWSGTSGLNTLTLGVGDTVERPFINKKGTFLAMLHESEGKREAILWSLAEGNEAWRVELTRSTYLLAVNRNGNTLAAADENTLTIFNQNGRQSRSREFNAKIRGIYFTDDDSSVLLILDTTVMKVELEDLSRAITTSYSKTVEDLSFSPDGKLLAATTGRDVNVQDIASGLILASWITAARVNDLCFLASGREILTGDSQNRATVWNWRPEDWIGRACQRLTRNLSELEMQNYLPGIPYRATCPDLVPLSREQLVNEMFPGSD